MNISSFIAKRIAFNRQSSFLNFIIRLAVAATLISVAAMIVTVALTSGFQYAISQKVFSFWGDIRVQHYEAGKAAIAEEMPIEKNDTVLQVLRNNSDVKTIQAFATKNAIIKGPESIEGVLLKGIEKNYDFSNINGFLKEGKWLQFADSGYSTEINLSTYTANRLKLKVNDKAIIYFIQPDGSHRIRKMTVAGLFKTGIEDYDKLYAIADLKMIQRLNNWNKDEIGGYEIFVKDYHRLDSVSDQIAERLPALWNSQTIKQVYPYIFDWLSLQNTTIAIALIIIIIVAALNLVTCLIVLVLDRTQMIGILKSVGAPNATIQKIFLYNVSFITISGILFGNLLAFLLCWLQQRYGFITLPEDAYFISTAVVKLNWWQVLAIDAGTLLACFLVLVVPTLIIRKIRPAKAVQFR
ncbi:MAG: ABC transporter permease [Bacteroidetes bacterium]|nr:ABC transporter permease [Bacteroidota bacterium]MBS1975316.1 ABC transporter permease [Bacteroidota bacterium]